MDNTIFQNVNVNDGKALDWGDEISNDNTFVILPEGEYDFTVISFERGRHPGSEKLPPCHKAIITLKLYDSKGNEAELKHNLFLHSKCEGMLCNFFTAIGQRKRGEPLRMNWQSVTGAKGKCKISVRTWKNKNTGEDMQSNEIKSFIEPKEVASRSFTAGDF